MADKTWIGGASGNLGDFGTHANWFPSGVPVASDVLYFNEDATNDLDDGLNQSALTGMTLIVYSSFSRAIGTVTNALQIGASISHIGLPSGRPGDTGASLVNLEYGGTQNETTLYSSQQGRASDDGERVRIVGTNASNVLNVVGGTVGTGTVDPTDTTTWSEINLSGGSVAIGDNATLTTINLSGGTLTNFGSNVTTINQSGGTYTVFQSATHTSIVQQGGVCVYNSNGTVTNLTIGGTWDSRRDPRNKTVTNCTILRGGVLQASTGNPRSVTFTNGIDLEQHGIGGSTIDVGPNVSLAVSAIA